MHMKAILLEVVMYMVYAGLSKPECIRETAPNSIMSLVMLQPNIFTSRVLLAANMSLGAPSSRVARGCACGSPAVNFANLGPCPPITVTTAKLAPFVLEALRTKHPCHQSPLQLSKLLWSEAERDVQHAMKVRVSYVLQHNNNNNITLICCAMCGEAGQHWLYLYSLFTLGCHFTAAGS